MVQIFKVSSSNQSNSHAIYLIENNPNVFISQLRVITGSHQRDEFVLHSKVEQKDLGFMVCSKLNMPFRKDYNGQTLGIDYLEVNPKRKGFGSLLLDFAKFFSKEQGCNGYICLKADSSLNRNEAPHQFYRKNSFSTLNPKTDKLIDKFIKQSTQGTFSDFKPMLMFYPPQKESKNKIILPNLLLKLKNISYKLCKK